MDRRHLIRPYVSLAAVLGTLWLGVAPAWAQSSSAVQYGGYDQAPWCAPEPPGNEPRPTWAGIEAGSGVPDYENPSTIFNIQKTLTLVATLLERVASKVTDLAASPEFDDDQVGYCLCNCNSPPQPLSYWLDLLQSKLKTVLLGTLDAFVQQHFGGLLTDMTSAYDSIANLRAGLQGDIATQSKAQVVADAFCQVLNQTPCNAMTGGVNLVNNAQKGLQRISDVGYETMQDCVTTAAQALPQQILDALFDVQALAKVADEIERLRNFFQNIDQSHLLDPAYWKNFVETDLPAAVLDAFNNVVYPQLIDPILQSLEALVDLLQDTPKLIALDHACILQCYCPGVTLDWTQLNAAMNLKTGPYACDCASVAPDTQAPTSLTFNACATAQTVLGFCKDSNNQPLPLDQCLEKFADDMKTKAEAFVDEQSKVADALLKCTPNSTPSCDDLCQDPNLQIWCEQDNNGVWRSPVASGLEAVKAEVDAAKAKVQAGGSVTGYLQAARDALSDLAHNIPPIVKAFIDAKLPLVKANAKLIFDKEKDQAQQWIDDFIYQNLSLDNGSPTQQTLDSMTNAMKAAVDARLGAARTALQGVVGTAKQMVASDHIEKVAREAAKVALDEIAARLGINIPEIVDAINAAKTVVQDVLNILQDPAGALDQVASLTQAQMQQCVTDTWTAMHAEFMAWCQEQFDGTGYPPTACQDPEAAWNSLQADIESAVQQRLAQLKQHATTLKNALANRNAMFQAFANSALTNLQSEFSTIEGCVGIVPYAECNNDPTGFCAGTTTATLMDGIELPFWAPTDVFKDAKSGLKFALQKTRALDKLACVLISVFDSSSSNTFGGCIHGVGTGVSEAVGFIGDIVDFIHDLQDVIAQIMDYIDRFVSGYHLGGYDDLRADLNYCVGFGGAPAKLDLVNTTIAGHHIGAGAFFHSLNLSSKARAQFRAGGLEVSIDDKIYPIAPNAGFTVQIDGFRLWDQNCLFGIPALCTGSSVLADQAQQQYDVFHLLDDGELGEIMCPNNPTNCPMNFATLLYQPYYPITYEDQGGTTHTWPRSGVAFDEQSRLHAVVGAGGNLKLGFDIPRKDLPPITVLGVLNFQFWFKANFGIEWVYKTNWARDLLYDAIDANLPSGVLPADIARRDDRPMQPPDVSEDVGIAPWLDPTVGLDVTLGLQIGKWLRMGLTGTGAATVHMAPLVNGGIFDAKRPIVDAWNDSDPDTGSCDPVWDTQTTTYCSNEWYRHPGWECAGDYCRHFTAADGGPYSTQTYSCDGNGPKCTDYGRCVKEVNGQQQIVALDVTFEQCEGSDPGLCVLPQLPAADGSTGSVVYLIDPAQVAPGNNYAVYSANSDWFDHHATRASWMASSHLTQADCTTKALCIGPTAAPANAGDPAAPKPWDLWSPPVPVPTYPVTILGEGTYDPATGACTCNVSGVDENGDPLAAGARCIPYAWQPPQDPGQAGAHWFEYACLDDSDSTLTGWTGDGCSALVNGFPSACSCTVEQTGAQADLNCAQGETCSAGACTGAPDPCTCDPNGTATCPQGRLCFEGACIKECTTNADCGPNRVCDALPGSGGMGCVVPGVKYAEQIAWLAKTAAQRPPTYSVESYARTGFELAVIVHLGIQVAAQIKLFRKWRGKTLWSWSDDMEVLGINKQKVAPGVEARYESGCDVNTGEVLVHQTPSADTPGTRYQGQGTSGQSPPTLGDLLDWCYPQASDEASVSNPEVGDPVDDTLGSGGIAGTYGYAQDLAISMYEQHQICIDGVPWATWLDVNLSDPQQVFQRMTCYYHPPDGSAPVPLTVNTPDDIPLELMAVTGCFGPAWAGQSLPNGYAFWSRNLADNIAWMASHCNASNASTLLNYIEPVPGGGWAFYRLKPSVAFPNLNPDQLSPSAPIVSPAVMDPTLVALYQVCQSSLPYPFFDFPHRDLMFLLHQADACLADTIEARENDGEVALECVLDIPDPAPCPPDPQCNPTSPPPGFGCHTPTGDTNGNGLVNVVDTQCSILVALWEMAGNTSQPPPSCVAQGQPLRADLDCNLHVNVVDVLLQMDQVLLLGLPLWLDADGDGCADACTAPWCGDCSCDPGETCTSCPKDCGDCQAQGQSEVRPCCTAGTCAELTQADCQAGGGTWLSYATACGGPDYCATHMPAACCLQANCQMMSPIDCTAAGGSSKGAGTTCASVQCP